MDEDVVTMLDVLLDEESLEVDAKAVLGNADDSNCSYHTGGNYHHSFCLLNFPFISFRSFIGSN